MFRNYIIVALRHLSRQRVFVLINLFGLALGMAFSILIVLFIRHEKSYDQFHDNSNRIYRITEKARLGSRDLGTLWMPYPLPSWLNQNVPGVESAIHLLKGSHKLVFSDSISLPASGFYYSDPAFFQLFSFPLLLGNPDSALSQPFSLVITRSTARQYFGTQNPLGKKLHLDNGWTFTVTGMCEDVPSNSHFHFDFMASLNGITEIAGIKEDWMNHVALVYVLLKKDVPASMLEQSLQQLVNENIIPGRAKMLGMTPKQFLASGNQVQFQLQELHSIHLNSHFDGELEANSSPLYLYIYSVVAALILIVACVNFVNLGTARYSVRAREIAQRKILGATKNELVLQFLAEAVTMTFLSLFLALALIELLISPFNLITGKNLEAFSLSNLYFAPWLILGTLILGIISGLWPSLILSGVPVTTALRGLSGLERGGLRFRKMLVLLQFTVTLLFIIGSITIFQQVRFYREKNLGFDKTHIMVVQRAYALEKQKEKFREAILTDPAVTGVSFVTEIPGEGKENSIIPIRKGASETDSLSYIRITGVDADYARTMGLRMTAGAFFSESPDSNVEMVILNKAATRQLKMENPVGKTIFIPSIQKQKEEKLLICGVIDDFHFESLRNEVEPLLLYRSSPNDHLQYMLIRFEDGNAQNVLQETRKRWQQLLPGQPFETFFINDQLNEQYREENMTARLMGLLSLISILIAVLGLLGLSFFMADRKSREIGIRKSQGASVQRIILQLSLEYLSSLGWSILIAVPLSLAGMYFWLHQFPYHVLMSPLTFVYAAAGICFTGLVTILYHTLKSAGTNPSIALHYE